MKRLFILISAVLFFASCEVEFSPNDQWREIPVVYCLLDQDEDTTFVRLERCFLGEGDQRNFFSNRDSLYYPQGSVKVFIEEWALNNSGTVSGNEPKRVFDCDYMEVDNRNDGLFYDGIAPLYACRTAGLLDTSCLYRLRIVKTSNGDTIVKGETRLVRGEMQLVHPAPSVQKFEFGGSSKECELEWTTLSEARQYQPIVRFRYRDFIVNYDHNPVDTTINYHHIDIPGNTVKSNLTEKSLKTRMELNYFLSTIKNNIKDTVPKNIIDTVDIFIVSCTESFAAYLYANHPAGGISQEPFEYTNIEGGLGVFAARRRHISFKVGTRSDIRSLYVSSLKNLGVGF